MNLCRECGQDFGSLKAFDAHRAGKHAYAYTEGLDLDPPREDGRRCLGTDELEGLGWRRGRDGRWRTPADGVVWGSRQGKIGDETDQVGS